MTGYEYPPALRVSPKATVQANTADTAMVASNFGKIQTNTGAAGTIVLTLPAAASVAGLTMLVQITAAQIVRLTPAAGEKVYLGGSGVASKYANIAAVIGNYVQINSDGVDYQILDYSGVVTKEA